MWCTLGFVTVFNGLVGRKCSSILRKLHGPGHVILVILGSLNAASRGDSQAPARIYWVEAAGKAWCEVREGTRNRLHCSCFGRSLQIVWWNKTHTLGWMTTEGFCGYLFIFKDVYLLLLHWVSVAVLGLSLVAGSRGCSWLPWPGFSLRWLLSLWSTASRHPGSGVVAHGLSCSVAYGIFLDQESNLCPLQWQVDLIHCANREVLQLLLRE